MTDLARLALLLTDQAARDEAPCVPVSPEGWHVVLQRDGSIASYPAELFNDDGSDAGGFAAQDCIATLDLPALVASAARMREVLAQMEAFAAQVWRDDGHVWTADDVAWRVHRDARVVLKTVSAALEEKP
jgi:hypothetical protein